MSWLGGRGVCGARSWYIFNTTTRWEGKYSTMPTESVGPCGYFIILLVFDNVLNDWRVTGRLLFVTSNYVLLLVCFIFICFFFFLINKCNTQTLQVTIHVQTIRVRGFCLLAAWKSSFFGIVSHWLLCFYFWRRKVSAYFHLSILPLPEICKTSEAWQHQLPPDVSLYIQAFETVTENSCVGVSVCSDFYHNYKTIKTTTILNMCAMLLCTFLAHKPHICDHD